MGEKNPHFTSTTTGQGWNVLPDKINLLDLVAPITKVDQESSSTGRTVDRELLHLAIYAADPNKTHLPGANEWNGYESWYDDLDFFTDINESDKSAMEKAQMRMDRSKALTEALNEASTIVSNTPTRFTRNRNPWDFRWSDAQSRTDHPTGPIEPQPGG